jgi:sporulation protein YqfC
MTNKNYNKKTVSKLQYRFKNKIAKALDIPKDLLFDLPRVTMIGNVQLYVENHIGLLEFSDTRIRLHTKSGNIYVYGSSLIIRSVMFREILIEGIIENVKWKLDDINTEG